MIELTDWLQQNWLEFGTLLAQAMIPIVLVWYGRKVVKTLGASRAEAESVSERSISVPRQLVPLADSMAAGEHEEVKPDGPGVARRFAHWMQQPMASRRTSPSAWRRVARWLQAPAGS